MYLLRPRMWYLFYQIFIIKFKKSYLWIAKKKFYWVLEILVFTGQFFFLILSWSKVLRYFQNFELCILSIWVFLKNFSVFLNIKFFFIWMFLLSLAAIGPVSKLSRWRNGGGESVVTSWRRRVGGNYCCYAAGGMFRSVFLVCFVKSTCLSLNFHNILKFFRLCRNH